jgi:hypothetical protein
MTGADATLGAVAARNEKPRARHPRYRRLAANAAGVRSGRSVQRAECWRGTATNAVAMLVKIVPVFMASDL